MPLNIAIAPFYGSCMLEIRLVRSVVVMRTLNTIGIRYQYVTHKLGMRFRYASHSCLRMSNVQVTCVNDGITYGPRVQNA